MCSTKSHLDETRLCTLASNQGRRLQTLTRHSTGFFSQFSWDIALYIHAVLSIVISRSTIQTLCAWHTWDAPETSKLLVSNRSYNATAATKKHLKKTAHLINAGLIMSSSTCVAAIFTSGHEQLKSSPQSRSMSQFSCSPRNTMQYLQLWATTSTVSTLRFLLVSLTSPL